MDIVRAVCIWSGWHVAKSGTESIKLKFQVEDNVPGISTSGTTLYADLWLSDKALDNTVKTLREAMGWTELDPYVFVDNHDTLTGIEVDLAVDWEEYNGKRELKVKFVNPVGGIPDPVTQVDRESARKKSDALRAKLMMYDQNQKQKEVAAAAAGGAKAKPVQKPKPAPAPSTDVPPVEQYDDVPPGPEDEDDGLPF
jgi:hypothetical protein